MLRAAREGGVKRFVFASSNWVLGGYRFRPDRLAQDTPPRPINPYGASKLAIERVGRAMEAESGMGFLSLRIGYCQPGANLPGPHMAFGLWGQQMWLGNADWAQAVVRSCTVPFEGFHAVNVVSRNTDMRWDLEEARTVIGYMPEESHAPIRSMAAWLKDKGAGLRERFAPSGAAAPFVGRRW